MAKERLFAAPRSRLIAATVGVLLAATLITAAMPAWLPLSEANSLVLPIVLFPVTWLLLFFWVLFAKSMLRTWIVLVLVVAANLALIATSVGAL